MLDGQIDGVSFDPSSVRRTFQRIRRLAEQTPLVYLPAQGPDAAKRLENKIPALDSPRSKAAVMPALL
jgi:hypothetical protein